MVNPSIEGLVKIGKTTREPESRAKELSQATGVATPFYVAFSIRVPDCHTGEEFVHAILDHNGFRQTTSREFFQIPLRQAIEVLMLAEKELVKTGFKEELQSSQNPGLQISQSGEGMDVEFNEHPGRTVFDQAIKFYKGEDEEIEDKEEAIRLLERAKSLNFPAAFTALAQHFLNEAQAIEELDQNFDTEVSWPSRKSALSILKEGTTRGHGRCWIMMAQMHHHGEIRPEQDWKTAGLNANKCWKKYFSGNTFQNDDDEKWTEGLGELTLSTFDKGCSRISHIRFYLNYFISNLWMSMDVEIKQLLVKFKSELTTDLQDGIAYAKRNGSSEYAVSCQKLLEFVQNTL